MTEKLTKKQDEELILFRGEVMTYEEAADLILKDVQEAEKYPIEELQMKYGILDNDWD